MIFWRKILFYIFFIFYTFTTPLLILRMLGFIWHPASFHLVKTGLVTIDSTPHQAHAFIDGKRTPSLTPTTARELIPGEHFLRIEKEGFKDWVGHFTIISNQATTLGAIHLEPINSP